MNDNDIKIYIEKHLPYHVDELLKYNCYDLVRYTARHLLKIRTVYRRNEKLNEFLMTLSAYIVELERGL